MSPERRVDRAPEPNPRTGDSALRSHEVSDRQADPVGGHDVRADGARESIPAVCFIDDVARILRTSRRTIEKLRRHRCFHIPELPSIDKRPRWSGEAVKRFLDGQRPLSRGWKRSA